MRRWWWVLAIFLAGCAGKSRWPEGVLIPMDPVQTDVAQGRKWSFKGYLLQELARFDVYGRVLLTESFATGREAELAPKDLTLGWGAMSNSAYLSQIRLAHVDRYFQWEIRGEVPDKETIIPHAANMHIIPADEKVATALSVVRRDDLVRIVGRLVRVDAPDGWSWCSSTSRSDTGDGACELIFAEKLETLLAPPKRS